MACGTGKTLTTLWIKETLNSRLTLYLVPSLSLLSQVTREWSNHSNEKIKILCICSDTSVAKRTRMKLMKKFTNCLSM